MTDIVDELKSSASLLRRYHSEHLTTVGDHEYEHPEWCDPMADGLDRAAAEIERLKAALHDIGYQSSYIGLYSEGWARERARKELEKKHD